MLNKAIDSMPEVVHEKERFEIPKIKGHLEGNKTIVVNLRQISETLERPKGHLFKFLLRELAAPGIDKGINCVFGSKIPSALINDKIAKYANEFVLCRKCGKPDTQLVKEGDLTYLKCQACAEKYPVKTK